MEQEVRPHVGTFADMVASAILQCETQAAIAAVVADLLSWYTVGYPAERLEAIRVLATPNVED